MARAAEYQRVGVCAALAGKVVLGQSIFVPCYDDSEEGQFSIHLPASVGFPLGNIPLEQIPDDLLSDAFAPSG